MGKAGNMKEMVENKLSDCVKELNVTEVYVKELYACACACACAHVCV